MCLAWIKDVMLNNRAKKNSKKVLENLQIRSGDVVADIGSGSGYYNGSFCKINCA